MKKAALIAAALAMVLTLAACGNRDNNDSNNQPNNNTTQGDTGTNQNNSGTANHDPNSVNNGSSSMTNNGTGSTTNSGTNSSIGNGAGSSVNNSTGDSVTGARSMGRSTVGNDLRRAADDVGDAVTDMVDGGRDALTRTTSTTTFQQMLDNARVHDTDGVLADGENSRR